MSFYTEVIMADPRFRSTESIRDLALLEPETRAAVEGIIADAKQQGIDLIVAETYRSAERQQMLFQHGATKLQAVGVHHYGLAADFARLVDGKAFWSGSWAFLGELADRHELIWGGNWGTPGMAHSFVDFDHVQRCALADQRRLFAGIWYPDVNYDPCAPARSTT